MRLPITIEAPSLQYAARLPGKLFVLGSTNPVPLSNLSAMMLLLGVWSDRSTQLPRWLWGAR